MARALVKNSVVAERTSPAAGCRTQATEGERKAQVTLGDAPGIRFMGPCEGHTTARDGGLPRWGYQWGSRGGPCDGHTTTREGVRVQWEIIAGRAAAGPRQGAVASVCATAAMRRLACRAP